jgi:7,8-dihydropterin-6-yl-methyl-4-(beta-D-ribofuranosyl)aminobenzene 5'-phosphate synthase
MRRTVLAVVTAVFVRSGVVLALAASMSWPHLVRAAPPATPPISSARVTILSTMLAEASRESTLFGEWGFSAVIEANGHRVLFDTGATPETVLRNAEALGIDLSGITDVVLSHSHWDHTGGLVTLRRQLAKKNPAALSRAHVGPSFFWTRTSKEGKPYSPTAELRSAYEESGGKFIEHDGPAEVFPGVWLTGPIPRIHPERNYRTDILVKTPEGIAPDDVRDEISLVLDATEGLVVVTGCGHSGIVNTLDAARARVRDAKVATVVGGFHLFGADDATLDWTGAQLKRTGVAHVIGAHCTGIEAVYRLRQAAGLDRKSCVVGAVGASYELGKGIDPGRLAR